MNLLANAVNGSAQFGYILTKYLFDQFIFELMHKLLNGCWSSSLVFMHDGDKYVWPLIPSL